MKRNKIAGHLMIIFTQIILGINIPITRDLLLHYLSPLGYIGISRSAPPSFSGSYSASRSGTVRGRHALARRFARLFDDASGDFGERPEGGR